MQDTIIVTAEGFDKLKRELAERLERRKQIASKIEYAKSLGDLSENFEYQEAKEDQSFNESRIMELEAMISRSVVSDTGDTSSVTLGATITVTADGKSKKFTIVSFNEAEPAKGLISNASPIGMALLNRKIGDAVTIQTPRGAVHYVVTDIA